MTAEDVSRALNSLATPEKAETSAWFFKSGPGQYGEGDQFLGVTVPEQRKIARQHRELPLEEIKKLLRSPWHEERLTALFILVARFERANQAEQQKIYEFYMANLARVNNWDLVDSSASYIAGAWLNDKPQKSEVLIRLAASENIWERRVAIISTHYFIRAGQAETTLLIAEQLLSDQHDLIHKAVGWMLRELGKRVDRQLLIDFLDKYAAAMPRTALRYAIEHLPKEQRKHYLLLKVK